jgi:hypothetical protein
MRQAIHEHANESARRKKDSHSDERNISSETKITAETAHTCKELSAAIHNVTSIWTHIGRDTP